MLAPLAYKKEIQFSNIVEKPEHRQQDQQSSSTYLEATSSSSINDKVWLQCLNGSISHKGC